LIASLQNEVRILLHLAGKIEPRMLDYRPTPKQRSTLELLRYLSVMGPALVRATQAGGFDPAAWKEDLATAEARDLDQTLAAIDAHRDQYATLVAAMSDADFRTPIEMFGNKTTKGAFIVNFVLAAYAAYRLQLFLYLKSCGRAELGTSNLWGGVDAPVAV
jgi:hypothetical protein